MPLLSVRIFPSCGSVATFTSGSAGWARAGTATTRPSTTARKGTTRRCIISADLPFAEHDDLSISVPAQGGSGVNFRLLAPERSRGRPIMPTALSTHDARGLDLIPREPSQSDAGYPAGTLAVRDRR